jgi:hypothetical protein
VPAACGVSAGVVDVLTGGLVHVEVDVGPVGVPREGDDEI